MRMKRKKIPERLTDEPCLRRWAVALPRLHSFSSVGIFPTCINRLFRAYNCAVWKCHLICGAKHRNYCLFFAGTGFKKRKAITGNNVKPGESEFLLLLHFPWLYKITAFILLLTPLLAPCLLNGPLATQQCENMRFFVLQLTEKGHALLIGCFDDTHLQTWNHLCIYAAIRHTDTQLQQHTAQLLHI